MARLDTGVLLGAAGAVATAGAGFMTVTGLGQGDSRKSPWSNSWFDAGFALVIFGLALVVVALLALLRRDKPSCSQPVHPPLVGPLSGLTLGNIRISGKSRLRIDSSAERFADDGTEITDEATVSGRHFPGHPELLNVRADDEQAR